MCTIGVVFAPTVAGGRKASLFIYDDAPDGPQVIALSGNGVIAKGYAWGSNVTGQLGDGTTTQRLNPGEINTLSSVTVVAAGVYHSLALKADGTVWAWGDNGGGQHGDGTTTQRLVPMQVNGLSAVTMIAAGGFHSLGLKADGTVWAWGSN